MSDFPVYAPKRYITFSGKRIRSIYLVRYLQMSPETWKVRILAKLWKLDLSATYNTLKVLSKTGLVEVVSRGKKYHEYKAKFELRDLVLDLLTK